MMRFMCTVRMDPEITDKMTEADWQQFQHDTRVLDDELMASGKFVIASPLDGDAVKTLRLRSGKLTVIDGPFAETKEFLAGFIIFDASSHEDALAIAERSAFVRVGSVELRELTDYEGREPAGAA
jgi:hypothetical protein